MVPLMVMVTLLGVPSMEVTLKVSLSLSPTFRESKAALAVKPQLPSASMEKLP